MSEIVPIEKTAIDILRGYSGANDYILYIQNKFKKDKSFSITKNQCRYVIKNHNLSPLDIGKVVKIHESCEDFLKGQLGFEGDLKEIFVHKLLSRDGDMLHLSCGLSDDSKNTKFVFINKNCIIKEKEKPELDFSKYSRPPKPHQVEAIEKLLVNEKFILADDMGLGKSLPVNTLIYTPKGVKKIGELKVGDKVIGSNGKPCKVTGVFPQGYRETYKITFNDNCSIFASDDHIWSVAQAGMPKERLKKYGKKYINLTTKQMYEGGIVTFRRKFRNTEKTYNIEAKYKVNEKEKWQIPIVKPINFRGNEKLPIDPYLFGLILGKGIFKNQNVVLHINENESELFQKKYNLPELTKFRDKRKFLVEIDGYLYNFKHWSKRSEPRYIPDIYKYSTLENRISLVQGLMDSIGYCTKKGNSKEVLLKVSTSQEKLFDDFCELVQTIGGWVRKKFFLKNEDDVTGKITYKKPHNASLKFPRGINPFLYTKEAEIYFKSKRSTLSRTITKIEKVEPMDSICISVDSEDNLYVAEHCIVTHNTTSSIIAAIEGGFERILVVCPASLKLNWKKEIMNYDSESNISVVDGINFTAKKWTIVNYDILKNFHNISKKNIDSVHEKSTIDFYDFDLVIADEAHYLKNFTSNRTKLFKDFSKKIKNRWFLTGTPITNKPIDFFSLLNMCDSPIASNWVFYVTRYCAGKQINRKGSNKKFWLTTGASNLDELRNYSSNIVLRRTKKDSLNLPQKTIKPIYLPDNLCVNYQTYMSEYRQWVDEMKVNGEKPSVSDHLTKLINVRLSLSNDKIPHTISMAEELIEQGHKIIIFSCFSKSINDIHEHFGDKSVLIDGSISKEKRQLAVDKFQTDNGIKVFCGNIIAAGVGLTLTSGNIVIFNDLDWTPTNHAQAEDRSLRIGQENDVHVIYPLFDNTLDVAMYKVLRDKMKVINQIMGDSNIVDTNSAAKDVIENLK